MMPEDVFCKRCGMMKRLGSCLCNRAIVYTTPADAYRNRPSKYDASIKRVLEALEGRKEFTTTQFKRVAESVLPGTDLNSLVAHLNTYAEEYGLVKRKRKIRKSGYPGGPTVVSVFRKVAT